MPVNATAMTIPTTQVKRLSKFILTPFDDDVLILESIDDVLDRSPAPDFARARYDFLVIEFFDDRVNRRSLRPTFVNNLKSRELSLITCDAAFEVAETKVGASALLT